MEVRIKHKLKGIYECSMNPYRGAVIEVPELIQKIFSQKEASKKYEHVMLGTHNLLWDGKEVQSMSYDASTNEICLLVSELYWHLCPLCHLGYEDQDFSNTLGMCPKCLAKKVLE